jgi:NIPSNAP
MTGQDVAQKEASEPDICDNVSGHVLPTIGCGLSRVRGTDMSKSKWRVFVVAAAVFVAGVAVGRVIQPAVALEAQTDTRVFELRTYKVNDGRLDALNGRFRNHTMRFFRKYGMTPIGYWRPADAPQSQNTIIAILAHPSLDAAASNRKALQADPEWRKVIEESEAQGPIVSSAESLFMYSTDYSPFK